MSIPGFAEWLATPLGQYVIAIEQRSIDQMVADVFGFHAVQVGMPDCDYLRENRIVHRFKLCSERAELLAQPETLPLASQSVDLVVLPHVLEYAPHPHQVLREVDRVLRPEGVVVIAGFNLFSLWGVRRLAARRDGVFPWQGQFLSVPRLRDWLALLDFESDVCSMGVYIPPVVSPQWIERWRFMDRSGPRSWRFAGGVYVIRAVKRVRGMRLIAPAWRNKLARAKQLAPVAHDNTKKVQQ